MGESQVRGALRKQGELFEAYIIHPSYIGSPSASNFFFLNTLSDFLPPFEIETRKYSMVRQVPKTILGPIGTYTRLPWADARDAGKSIAPAGSVKAGRNLG